MSTTTARTYTCPHCNEQRNADDATEAACVSCGVCAECVPSADGHGSSDRCAECEPSVSIA